MTSLATATPVEQAAVDSRAIAKSRTPDDMAMLRAAAELTRDLSAPRAPIYWGDFLASSLIGYAALGLAMVVSPAWAMALAMLVSVLALYRAGSFIHELTHIKDRDLPGFRIGWNALIGVPLMIPSFLYEGVHSLHHARTRYGTKDDPEYLPLALMSPWKIALFLLVSLLAPVGVLLRFGVLAPLSAIIPPLRRWVVEHASALSINPEFRRKPPEGELRMLWRVTETAAALWAIGLIAGTASGIIPLNSFLIFMGVISASVFLNQVRTLVAHRWENDGEVMTQTGQYLDSVNVPPPGLLPALWAPVGLRYHAMHHLMPALPYHALGEAHRRLTAALEAGSAYHKANYHGLPRLVMGLVRNSLSAR